MLSMEEKKLLLRMMLETEEPAKGLDVSSRQRDELGRFSPSKTKEEYRLRSIKLVKRRGTYGTFDVKDSLITETGLLPLIIFGVIVAFAFLH